MVSSLSEVGRNDASVVNHLTEAVSFVPNSLPPLAFVPPLVSAHPVWERRSSNSAIQTL